MASVQILDGGLGTSLEDKYGVKFDSSNPLWSSHFLITGQDTLLACQRDFGEAGVDVLLTATYQVSVEGFACTKTPGFPDGIPKTAIGPYLSNAIDIAEKATEGGNAKLALSLGPYGASMIPGQEYSGSYDAAHDSEDALYRWHLERLRLFCEVERLQQRVQYVAFETLPRLDEIRAVRRAIRAAGIAGSSQQAGPAFWISCVFPGEAEDLPDGSSIDDVVGAMLEPLEDAPAPWGIGINCTKIHKLPLLIQKFEASVKQMQSSSKLKRAPALVLYPDGTNGEVYNTTTKTWEKPEGQCNVAMTTTPWEVNLANAVNESKSRGVFESFLVGGCCKASHADIEGLRRQFEGLE